VKKIRTSRISDLPDEYLYGVCLKLKKKQNKTSQGIYLFFPHRRVLAGLCCRFRKNVFWAHGKKQNGERSFHICTYLYSLIYLISYMLQVYIIILCTGKYIRVKWSVDCHRTTYIEFPANFGYYVE